MELFNIVTSVFGVMLSPPGNREFVVTELETEIHCIGAMRMKTIYISESPG